jgi:hypothetical protein
MDSHANDMPFHFVSMMTAFNHLTQEVHELQKENAELKVVISTDKASIEKLRLKSCRTSFFWQVPCFSVRKDDYRSPLFVAFGHTFFMTIKKKQSRHEIFLEMLSKKDDEIGYKLFVGRYGQLMHYMTSYSGELVPYPTEDGLWVRSCCDIPTDDINRQNILTADGTLQFKILLYKNEWIEDFREVAYNILDSD